MISQDLDRVRMCGGQPYNDKRIERICDQQDNATRLNSGYGMEVRELIAVVYEIDTVYVLRRESRARHVIDIT